MAHELQVHIRKLSTRDASSSVTGFEEEMKVSPSIVPCSAIKCQEIRLFAISEITL